MSEKKSIRFLGMNGKTLGLLSIIIIMLITGALTIYYIFKEKVPVDYFATRFCECAGQDTVQQSSAVLSNDDFKYSVKMEPCVGEEFKSYEDYLTEDEKFYYLDKIKRAVVDRCPLTIDSVFVNIPQPRPLPYIDSSAYPYPEVVEADGTN